MTPKGTPTPAPIATSLEFEPEDDDDDGDGDDVLFDAVLDALSDDTFASAAYPATRVASGTKNGLPESELQVTWEPWLTGSLQQYSASLLLLSPIGKSEEPELRETFAIVFC